ncbi:hypothetical protein AOX58_10910 [Acinetobacter baumannii]|jgi:allophanate hydrolase subunit 2|uniref:hypothetical protein n=1 Tax=Acinetobacter baumannii TaxID=470 RepID=UPI0007072D2E|nr:hypothetical protein [Acinetobacter baumannii]KQK67674.1 hypothetical protein AOX58_10910 [Acinetobacter baumannii]
MKFKVEVTKTFTQDHIIDADDANHAREIASEISEFMEASRKTFFESTWQVTPVDPSNQTTYQPQQSYLK